MSYKTYKFYKADAKSHTNTPKMQKACRAKRGRLFVLFLATAAYLAALGRMVNEKL